jgi:hypothetical protein
MVHPNAAGLNRGAIVLWMFCGFVAPAPGMAANDAGLPPADGGAHVKSSPDPSISLFDFNIPAQSLTDALDQFGLVSGRSALFRSALAAGLNSSAVHGRYTATVALRLLLEGTGLDVKEVSAGEVAALVLIPAVGGRTPPVAVEAPSVDASDSYDGLIQRRVWNAICANPRTADGGYRSLLRFGVDASGEISRPRLISSTGDHQRDAALLDVLQHVRIDQPPPPALAQPLTMLILPARDGGPVCDARAR